MVDHRLSSCQVTDSLFLDVHEISGTAGPTLTVLGGIHGDEPEGTLACDILVGILRKCRRLRGRVVIVPRANPLAVAANTRTSPDDGLNLARVFPGRTDGTTTQRLARTLFDKVISGSDGLVDLHSAGSRASMPFFCGYHELGDDCARRAATMADAFSAPITWAHDSAAPGRSLFAARSLGIPAIYVESGGGGQVVGEHLDGYVKGVLRVLSRLEMTERSYTDEIVPPATRRIVRGGYGDVDSAYPADVAGRWVTRAQVGTNVAAGSVLGELRGDDGQVIRTIAAERDSCVMRLRRQTQVQVEDALAMVAPLAEPLPAKPRS